MRTIKPKALQKNDTIGILAPCYGTRLEFVQKPAEELARLGYRVVFSKNLFSTADGYAGSVRERAEDFNEMIADESVSMLLFGGGEVGNEILPYIDYENVARHPKIVCSYSDGTTLLNALRAKTGLVTFYGASPRTFDGLTDYNRRSFLGRVTAQGSPYEKSGAWTVLCEGVCEGVLTGGYLVNYAAMQGGEYFALGEGGKVLLFIEDHVSFSSPAALSKWFSHLEQRGVFDRVAGLVFGHYAKELPPEGDGLLRRLGARRGIPVVRCEDFGHGEHNAVWPIGVRARLDTASGSFELLESGVLQDF